MIICPESDEALVKRLLPSENPDPEDRAVAWEAWWEFARVAVLRYVRYINCTRTDDDEIMQDALVTAYLQVERGRYTYWAGIPFTAYVKRIARNKVLEAYRRDKRSLPLDEVLDLEDDSLLEVTVEQREESATFRHRLQTLPQRRREVLTLFIEGHETARIATHLGIREDLVRQEKSRGLQELRRKIS